MKEKNLPYTTNDISAGSGKKFWWKCPKGPDHEWQDTPAHRASANESRGCPSCSGHQVSVTNALSRRFPEIAKEWHPVKNRPLTPDQVQIGTSRRVWWRCRYDASHEWEVPVELRTQRGTGCPYCSGRRAEAGKGLPELKSALMKQWDWSRNRGIDPHAIKPGSAKKVWWRCPKGADHRWRTNVAHRGKGGQGCPFCAGKKVSVTNSLAARFPALAREWHPEKNRALLPQNIVWGSYRGVWWRCRHGHEWRAKIESRTRIATGCPYCAGNLATAIRNFAVAYPRLLKQWHPAKNRGIDPRELTPRSNRRIWWRCMKGPDHEWNAAILSRTGPNAPNGCPFCSGRRVSVTNSLASLYPDIALQWHPKRNGKLRPDGVTAGTHRKVWWRCARGRGHEWETHLNSRTSKKPTGCPFCAGKRISEDELLVNAFPQVAAEWHPLRNMRIDLPEIKHDSIREVWWRCAKNRRHEWRDTPYHRTRTEAGCPECG